jgi:hypothetical protein
LGSRKEEGRKEGRRSEWYNRICRKGEELGTLNGAENIIKKEKGR